MGSIAAELRAAAGQHAALPSAGYAAEGFGNEDPPRPRGHPSLLLFVGTQGRLPARPLLAWRRGNHLDLLFLGFLGFPIASLLTLGHADLPGFCWLRTELHILSHR